MVLPLEPTEVPGVYRRGSKFVVVYRFTGRGYATEAVQLLVDTCSQPSSGIASTW